MSDFGVFLRSSQGGALLLVGVIGIGGLALLLLFLVASVERTNTLLHEILKIVRDLRVR